MADRKISDLDDATLPLDGTEEFVLALGGETLKITAADLAANLGGSGVGGSPADIPPDTPDAFDDEFGDSASLSDWTAYGASPTTEDIDTTVPGRLFQYRATSSAKLAGRYKAITIPGEYRAALGLSDVRANYQRGVNLVVLPTGAIGDSSPAVNFGVAYADQCLQWFVERQSDLSSYATTVINTGAGQQRWPMHYWRLVFNSTTSVDIYWSTDGIAWIPLVTAYNPGWAMDKLGWGSRSDSSTASITGSIDWIRRVA